MTKSNNYFVSQKSNHFRISSNRLNLRDSLFALGFLICGLISATETKAVTIPVDRTAPLK